MKKYLCIISFLLFQTMMFAQDIIILRNGSEINGKVELISNGMLTYNTNGLQKQLATTQLYMVKYKSRGNVFFSKEGDIIYNTENSGGKTSKKSIAIYLTEGSEIIATEINIQNNQISYKVPKGGVLGGLIGKSSDWINIAKDKVFLIRYSDGSKDVINDMAKMEEQARLDALPKVKHPFIPVNKDSSYPCPGNITMNDGTSIPIIIYDADREYVHYRKKDWQDGPIFRMSMSKIKIISTHK